MSCSHWLGERCTWPRLWRRAKIVNSAPESDEIIKDQLIWNRLQFFFRHWGSWNKGAAPNKEPWDPCSWGVLADMVKGHLQSSDRFSTSTAQHMGAHIDPSTFHLPFQKSPANPFKPTGLDGISFFLKPFEVFERVIWCCSGKGVITLGCCRESQPCSFTGTLVHPLDQGTVLRYLLYKVIIKFTNTSLNIDQPS